MPPIGGERIAIEYLARIVPGGLGCESCLFVGLFGPRGERGLCFAVWLFVSGSTCLKWNQDLSCIMSLACLGRCLDRLSVCSEAPCCMSVAC